MVDILLAGAIAGLAAALVMTVLMRPLVRGQPMPMATLASRLHGRPAEANGAAGTVLHLVYGTLMGALLAWGLDAWAGIHHYTFAALVGAGLLFGLALWLLGGWFWTPITGLDRRLAKMPADVRRSLATAYLGLHLVYGVVLSVALHLLPKESTAPRLTDGVLVAALAFLAVLLGIGAITLWRHDHARRHEERIRGAA